MYTPLYIKTDNSLQTSMIKLSDLIEFAKKNNINSLSITDNNMYGVMDFYKICKKNNIKPIIGLEITLENKKIVLYAINYNGYKNLLKLSTISSERNINIKDVNKYSSDLICIVPFDSLLLYDSLNKIFQEIYKSYKNKEEYSILKGENLIYMNETLYINKSDSKYIKYLDAIREGLDYIVENEHNDNYIHIDLNEYQESIQNNSKITNMCNVDIVFNQALMPKYKTENNIDSYTYLKKKCIEGLKNKFGNSVKSIYQERLKYELSVINKMGFCDYFLIVFDYVNWAKNNNIIVGTGRGSAVGSLVSYCLNITDVDPVKYNLLFERFLNPERISMPDIDIDFEHDKRETVINYCVEKYGNKKVVPIITFGSLGAKQALRDIGRVTDIDINTIDILCKMIDSRKTLKQNYLDNPKIKELCERKKELFDLYKIALKFEGLKRHTSIHAAGVVMSSIDLDEVIPLDYSHGFYVSGYDMTYLEEIGLLKMDFLAIKYLTTIHNIIDSINNEYKLNIEFDKIPLNDKYALNLFNKSNTLGIFQFESEGMIDFLRKLKVTSMNDLFAAIALFRPGPMANIPTYIKRKNNKEKVDYIHPSLENVLKPTYGIMIYQEQIMQIAQIMADYTLGEADILRKAMSKKKKDILLKEEEKFTYRALQKGYDKVIVNKVFNLMMKFAEYGFNKSHSIGYSIVAYKMAYLKSHYPKNFMTYLLSMEINDPNKTKQYIYEAKKYGIDILMPDINLSDKAYVIEKKGIRYPLTNIKNVGMSAVEVILNERSIAPFKDIYDFISRCYGKSVTIKTIESLIYAGVFNEFGYTRKTLINNLDLIINYADLIKDVGTEYAMVPNIKIEDEYTSKELTKIELDIFGLYLTNNPITEYKMKNNNITNLNEIDSKFDENINIIVYVDKIRYIDTSKGDKMAFLNISDELGSTDAVLFPKVYQKYNWIEQGTIILVKGKVEKRFDKYQIIVNDVVKLNN